MEVVELVKKLYEVEKDLNALRSKVFKIKEEMIRIEVNTFSMVLVKYSNQKLTKDVKDNLVNAELLANNEYQELKSKHHSLLKEIEDLEAYKRYLERVYNLLQANVISPEVVKDVEL